MSSHILKDYISKQKVDTEDKVKLVQDKYISQIYLHSLFLYSIFEQLNKKEGHKINQEIDEMIATLFKEYGEVLLYIDTNKEILNIYDE